MKVFIAFKYKLTSIIALIILLLLAAIFTVVQNDIEGRFRLLIEGQLIQAKDYVSQRMDDRYDLLYNDATAAVNDKLIFDVINDLTLSELTRNDIVSEEVLPKFFHLDALIVTDSDGKLLAQQSELADLTKHLINSDWFDYVKDGESVGGYVLVGDEFYQGLAQPVFLGEGMIGTVVAARALSQEDLVAIKQVSAIDISILEGFGRVASTEFSGISETDLLLSAFDQWLETQLTMQDGTIELLLGKERFMLQWVIDDTAFVPPYIIVRSLDESLLFVTNIRQTMIGLGSFGLIVAVLVAFGFAVSISSPIKRLGVATKEVAEENFSHQVNISSRDEFAQLGDSFNKMINELAEKQQIRSAFNKSVSKEVADHMLAQGAQLGGSKEFATVLFADIRGFTSLAESLDEKSLINLLNQYFSQVNGCIESRKGVIDKFIGDAVMALFGTPLPCEQSAYSALMASNNMLETVESFNEHCRMIYGCDIEIGIGLNSGHVVAGMVGSENRLNFTVLGDQVNIASRIEGLCKYYGVTLIVSESCMQEAIKSESFWETPIVFRQLDCVQVKGKSTGLNIYQPFFAPSAQQVVYIERFEQALLNLQLGNISQSMALLNGLIVDWPDDLPTVYLHQQVAGFLADRTSFERNYREGIRIATNK